MLVSHLRATLAALTVVMLIGVPAEAQRHDARDASARSEGYRAGARAGGDDARDGRPFEYQRHRDYRDGDRGHQSRNGRRDDYAQQYRAAFIAGYRDGYTSGGGRGSAGGYRRPAPSRDGRYGGRNGPSYSGRYPARSAGAEVAISNGFDEGYRKGFDDGRDRDRRDVARHSRYRNADQGYRRHYGPKGLYQQAYRAAFEHGYDEGYQDSRRSLGRGGIWPW